MQAEEVKLLIIQIVNSMMEEINDKLNTIEKEIEQLKIMKQFEESKLDKIDNYNQKLVEYQESINQAMNESFKIIYNQEQQSFKQKQTNNQAQEYLKNLQQIVSHIRTTSNINTQSQQEFTNSEVSGNQNSIISTNLSGIKNDQVVYATKFGTKFHKAGCEHLQHSKIPISKQQAQANGLTPCYSCLKRN